jgi:endonuclease G
MAAPGNRYAFDLKIAADAAKRWQSRQQARDRKTAAADNGQYTDADSKAHLAEHLNRLLKAMAATAPAGIAAHAAQAESMAIAAAAPSRAITAADISDQMVERVIGNTRDFLAILFFDKGTLASRAVCRIVTMLDVGQSFGTGFLVTPRLLITNHHVLEKEEDATNSTAEFNYQLNGDNAVLPVESFKLDPGSFFLTDVGLDFTLVAVSPRSATGKPLSSFGFCPLIGATGKIIIGQPVNIIQHPKGDLKQVVIRENRLLDLPDPQPGSDIDRFAHYEADTEPGSSGSPVFNDQWEVIALHHSGIPKTNAQGQPLDQHGNVWPQGGDPDQIDWVANEGIRASRLVDFISKAPVMRGKDLRDEFVAISHGEVQPQVNPEKIEEPIVPPSKPAEDVAAPATQVSQTVQTMQTVQAAPAGGAVSFTVPLTVTIGIGASGAPAPAMSADAAAAPSMPMPAVGAAFESGKPDPDLASRPGFDPNFLGFSAPLPKLMPAVAGQAAKVDGSGIELKYFNYSVIMNAARKLAFVSAVNLDAVAKFSAKRVGKDNWYYDDRISHDLQAGKELYADNPLDFGHLIPLPHHSDLTI